MCVRLVTCCVCIGKGPVCMCQGVFLFVLGGVSIGTELLCMAGQVSEQVRASCVCTARVYTHGHKQDLCVGAYVSREQLSGSLSWGCSLGDAPVPPPRAGTQAWAVPGTGGMPGSL